MVAVAVIIHLASDGRSVFDQEHKSLHVALVNTDDAIVSLTPKGIIVTCERNPVFVPVIQDLSKPFHLTKGEYSYVHIDKWYFFIFVLQT